MIRRARAPLSLMSLWALALGVVVTAAGHGACSIMVDGIVPASPPCVVGAKRCVSDLAQECGAGGTFVTIATCSPGACDATTGTCRPPSEESDGGSDASPDGGASAPTIPCSDGFTDSNGSLPGGTCMAIPTGKPIPCEAPTLDSNGGAAGGRCVDGSKTTGSGADCETDYFDTNGNAPGGTCAQTLASCTLIKNQFPSTLDGIYRVDFDGPAKGAIATDVYCIMDLKGFRPGLPDTLDGGWTAVAVYGTQGRPTQWSGNDYPRPGASHYGSVEGLPGALNAIRSGATTAIDQYSVAAAPLFAAGAREVFIYVGGQTKNYVTVALPASCNFFDGTTFCEENKTTGLTVRGDGVEFGNVQACTTAHRSGAWASDNADEFGLTLLQGRDSSSGHCESGATATGHEKAGRIFVSRQQSTNGWRFGVYSHWNNDGVRGDVEPQPAVLLLHGAKPRVESVELSNVTRLTPNVTMTIRGRAFTSPSSVQIFGTTLEATGTSTELTVKIARLPLENRYPLKLTSLGGGVDSSFVVVVCPKGQVDTNGKAPLGECTAAGTKAPILCDKGFIDSNGADAGGTCVDDGAGNDCDPGYVDTNGSTTWTTGSCAAYVNGVAPCQDGTTDSNGSAPGGRCVDASFLIACDPGFKDTNGYDYGGLCVPQ